MSRRSLAERAAPLHETLRTSPPAAGAAPFPPTRDTARRLAAWRETVARGDGQQFAERLQRDGLTEATAEALLAARAAQSPAGEPPTWLITMIDAYGWNGDRAPRSFRADEWPCTLDAERPLPFEPLLLPLVEVARERLSRLAPAALASVGPHVVGGALRSLLQRLTQICAIALYADFSVARLSAVGQSLAAWLGGSAPAAPDADFQRFVRTALDDRLAAFFDNYPVAARLCGTATELWVETMAEFFERLHADMPELSYAFGGGASLGALDAVEANAGDTHDGGRSVFIVRFSGGPSVVYKPRAVALEAFFANLVEWVNRADVDLDLRVPRHITRPGYGWIEFIDAVPCEDQAAAARFYERSGMLLALTYALHGTDFHLENLIAAGEHPILIDMEALITHHFELAPPASEAPGALYGARDLARESVLSTCMLPGTYIGHNGGVDIGGLAATAETEQGVVRVHWRDVNRDTMRLVHETATQTAAKHNLPVVDGHQLDGAAFVSEIAAGFRAVYQLVTQRRAELLDTDGLLQALRGQDVRFLFRHTNLYATLLRRTLHPEFLHDGADRGIQLEALARPLLAADTRPAAWSLFAAEVRALERLDVPLFAASGDSGAIRLDSGEEVLDCFRATALEQVATRMSVLGDEDLERQIRFIRAAFSASAAHGLALGTASRTDERSRASAAERTLSPHRRRHDLARQCVDEAHVLARATLDAAALWRNDVPAWFGIGFMPQARRYGVGALGVSLFDGLPGIALFLAALDQVDPTPRVHAVAVHIARTMQGELEMLATRKRPLPRLDLGAGTGLGGLLYAAVPLSRWLDMPELLAGAQAAAATVSPVIIAADRQHNVLCGAAGGVIGFLALHNATGHPDALGQAERCGRHLLASRLPYLATGLRAWPGHNGRADVGLAVGLGGIAAALHQLAEATDTLEFAKAAEEAIALERLLRRDSASHDDVVTWCAGDIACGAARLAIPRSARDTESHAEVETAIAAARSVVSHAPDSLCSGHMGRVEFLLHAGEALGRSDLVEGARADGMDIIDRSRRARGWHTPWGAGHTDVGFFHGLSGIGYECLRVVAPDRIPSVLHWSEALPYTHVTPARVAGPSEAMPAARQLAEVS